MDREAEERVQVHYHYHYYPSEGEERGERGRRSRENEKMSKSEIFAGWGQQRETFKEEGSKQSASREYLKGR